ncbi:uncharacterized protein LOC134283269 [Saccostrea cucullata]|uniref:uncharacterized protein LOC134283269 n=1 Tax=Saccostrea cuccullata TaxID=36930 RepID=UPI002ED07E6D
MDQSKTAIPHFVHASKFTSSMWKLRTHLVGVIIHGIGIYGFFDLFEYSHSTNLTLSILLSVFYSLRDSMPNVLYLQMDNCARENKNRYLLAFFCFLVEVGLFRKIKISFLMVGHTHEDVDQVFSKLPLRCFPIKNFLIQRSRLTQTSTFQKYMTENFMHQALLWKAFL